MKKFIKITVALIIVATGLFLVLTESNTDSPQKPDFLKNIDIQFEDNQIMAVVFLGGWENSYDYSTVEKYFTTTEFENFSFGGREKYLIVPRYDESIELSNITYTDKGTETEHVTTVKGCFYITCNQSDIMSNVMITTEHNGEKYEFSPFLSGKDGSLVLPEYVKELK